MQDVERVERPPLARLRRVGGGEHRRQDREVLGDVVRDRERRQRAARDQELLADLDDLDQLRRVRVEVDHVAGLLRRGSTGVHGDADVGLRERGSVVRAVAGHRDHPTLGLLVLDQRELRLRRRLGEEVVDPCLLCDHRGRDAVVARDHHRADAHPAQLVEALVHAALDDVLEVDDAEREVVARDDERRAALLGDPLDLRVELGRRAPTVLDDEVFDSVGGALADQRSPLRLTPLIRVVAQKGTNSCSPSSRSRRPKRSFASTTIERPSGRLVGERGELSHLGELALADARRPG